MTLTTYMNCKRKLLLNIGQHFRLLFMM